MKTIGPVLVVVATLCSILHAQQSTSKQPTTAFIEIGSAKLRLGMTKSEVAEKLVGSAIKKMNEDLWIIGTVSPSMQFTNGRLTFADRTWSTTNDNVAQSLYGVVSEFTSEGFSSCEVSADTKTSPTDTAQRVWIHCREKAILVVHWSIEGKSYDWVSERLGEYRNLSD